MVEESLLALELGCRWCFFVRAQVGVQCFVEADSLVCMEDVVVRAMGKDDMETGPVKMAQAGLSKELKGEMVGPARSVRSLMNVWCSSFLYLVVLQLSEERPCVYELAFEQLTKRVKLTRRRHDQGVELEDQDCSGVCLS